MPPMWFRFAGVELSPKGAENGRKMNHEEELIKAFFVPTKRERDREMVATPKKRQKFLVELAHFRALDPPYCSAVPKSEHSREQIAAFLTQGASRSCWVTWEDAELDGRYMPLWRH